MTKSRQRGRPRKATDVDPSDNQRREKMRELQRTFRRRKEEQHTALESRASVLESVIDEMTSTFLDMNDLVMSPKPGLHRLSQAELAKYHLERFLTLAQKAASSNDTFETRSSSQKSPSLESQSPAAFNTIREFTSGSETGPNTGRFSPRLTYGILPDFSQEPDMKLSSPPTHIMLAAAAGQDSFLSRLYWSITVYSLRALRGEAPENARITFRFSFKHDSPNNIASRALGAMQAMLYGRPSGERISAWPGFTALSPSQKIVDDEDLLHNLKAAIIKDIESGPGNLDDYIKSTDLEEYLRSQWGIVPDKGRLSLLLPEDRINAPNSQPIWNADFINVTPPQFTLDSPDLTTKQMQAPSFSSGSTTDDSNTVTQDLRRSNQISPGQDIDAREPRGITLSIEKLIEGLNIASVCFGNEMRFEKDNIDKAVVSVLKQAAVF